MLDDHFHDFQARTTGILLSSYCASLSSSGVLSSDRDNKRKKLQTHLLSHIISNSDLLQHDSTDLFYRVQIAACTPSISYSYSQGEGKGEIRMLKINFIANKFEEFTIFKCKTIGKRKPLLNYVHSISCALKSLQANV